jgi:hypothetical protein
VQRHELDLLERRELCGYPLQSNVHLVLAHVVDAKNLQRVARLTHAIDWLGMRAA